MQFDGIKGGGFIGINSGNVSFVFDHADAIHFKRINSDFGVDLGVAILDSILDIMQTGNTPSFTWENYLINIFQDSDGHYHFELEKIYGAGKVQIVLTENKVVWDLVQFLSNSLTEGIIQVLLDNEFYKITYQKGEVFFRIKQSDQSFVLKLPHLRGAIDWFGVKMGNLKIVKTETDSTYQIEIPGYIFTLSGDEFEKLKRDVNLIDCEIA